MQLKHKETISGGFEGIICKCGSASKFNDKEFVKAMHLDNINDYSDTVPIHLRCGICKSYLCTVLIEENEND